MRLLFTLLLSITTTCQCYSQAPARGSIVFSAGDSLRPSIRVSLAAYALPGLQSDIDENAPRWLSLHLLRGSDTAALAIAGHYQLQGTQLTLTPAYPLGYGSSYLIRWKDSSSQAHTEVYRTPALQASGTPARLLQVYPAGDTLPANLLFFYLRFDRPMQPAGNAWQHVRICAADSPGHALPFAWRQRSFWLDSNRLLVLMVHPGRVKSGIRYGGPLITPGKQYVLDIDSGLADAGGHYVRPGTIKQFYGGTEDHILPKIGSVSTEALKGSRETFQVRFSERMDHAAVRENITVLRDDSVPVAVMIDEAEGSRGERFSIVPLEPWKAGRYSICFGKGVTDLAANTLRRLFEMKDARESEKDVVPVKRFCIVR